MNQLLEIFLNNYLDGEQYLKITKGSIEEVIESNFITTSGDVIKKKDVIKTTKDEMSKMFPIKEKDTTLEGYKSYIEENGGINFDSQQKTGNNIDVNKLQKYREKAPFFCFRG